MKVKILSTAVFLFIVAAVMLVVPDLVNARDWLSVATGWFVVLVTVLFGITFVERVFFNKKGS